MLQDKEGQSLVEILIAVGIGALIIGAATYTISFIISSGSSNQQRQIATALAEDLLNRARAVADANWLDIYNLSPKSSTSTYHAYASGTKLYVIEGEEGILGDEVTNGLVGHWKFDEATGTTAYDYSGNGIHGTLTNGPTRATSTCEIGYCLSFDGGNDYVNISSLTYGNDVTFSVWFKGSSQTAGDWNYWVTSGNIRFEFGTFGDNAIFKDNGAAGTPNVSAGTAFVDNNWHNTVGLVRSNVMEIWVDGLLRATRSDYPTGQTHNNVAHKIGGNGGVRGWGGLMDDIRVYNRALTADEVKRLYNSDVFTRSFAVENVNRDVSENIVSSGGNEDPSTQKITANVKWSTAASTPTFQVIDYITRWKNKVFDQSDWSGGSGQEGPLTEPNDKFASSTSIDFSSTPGAIKVLLP